jgi:DNA ligase-1
MKLPTLYHRASKGDLRQWRVWTEGKFVCTEYGTVDGKLQQAQYAAEGKNIGRANATSPARQAELEAESKWTFKVERKYSETPEGAMKVSTKPMLAHKFNETDGSLSSKGKKVEYPVYVQPKLDGVRCIARRNGTGEIELTSRSGKPYYVPHIEVGLARWLPDDMVLDGEIYVHGESCQVITSWVKSADPDKTKRYKPQSKALEYHVYDVPTFGDKDDEPWKRRRHTLEDLVRHESSSMKIVTGITVHNDYDVWKNHGRCLQDGYEGAIIRAPEGIYKWGYRSPDLLKVKHFDDEEFEVLDCNDGKGKDEGCAVFVCRNNLTEGTFDVRMKGTLEERQSFYANRKQYFGRKLTVRFQGRTDAEIPRFPVGLVFRSEEDMPS